MNRKQSHKKIRESLKEFVLGRKTIEVRDINRFMRKLNKDLLAWSHDRVGDKTMAGHMDRRFIKDALRLYALQQLSQKYPIPTTTYLWKKIKEI